MIDHSESHLGVDLLNKVSKIRFARYRKSLLIKLTEVNCVSD